MNVATPAAHVRPAAPAVDASVTLLQRQRQVLEMIIQGAPLADVLAELCGTVEAEAPSPARAAILLVDPEHRQLRVGAAPSLPDDYNAAVDGIVIQAGLGTCSDAAATCRTVITPDIASAPGWQRLKHLPLGLGLRAAWSMPIVSSKGVVLGTFGTYFEETREPTTGEQELVGVLARTAALAIERERDDAALRASERHHRFLAGLAVATESLVDPDEVLATSARLLCEHLDADRCLYAEIQDRKFLTIGEYSRGLPPITEPWPMDAFGEDCPRLLMAGEPHVVSDTHAPGSVESRHLDAYDAVQARATICVPLLKGGVLSAAMAVEQRTTRQWTEDEIELVRRVVARCWEALERTRVARTLQRSELRYRAMVEANPECVKLLAPDGTVLQMNAAGLRMVGASDESQTVGHCVYNIMAPEHRESFRRFNERVCQGEAGSLSFEIINLAGERRFMETTAVPMAWPSGGYAHLAVTRDVTDRVRSERDMAESHARLDYAVRLSGVGFWYCDLPFQELVWDARVREHFFMPSDDPVDIETFYGRLHPDDREPTRKAIEAAIDGHQAYDVFYRTQDPDSGATKWIRALGGCAYAEDGTPVRFDGVTVDVTKQKLDQERLRQLLDSEREQARLLGEVAQAARTIHAAGALQCVLELITTEARRIIGTRQAVSSLTTGQDFEQAIHAVSLADEYARFADYSSPPTGAGIYTLVCEGNRAMRMTQAELEAHPRWRNLSGEGDRHPPMRGWLAVPFVARDGGNLGLIQLTDKLDGEFTDTDEAILTQLAQIAAVALENARLYEVLREQDRRKDEFLATLAHELRNPLAPIRTGLQVLDATHDPDQGALLRAMMERQLCHLVHIVDDLLDVSRITLGKINLARTAVDLREVVTAALETTGAAIDAQHHHLDVHLPDVPVVVDADRTRLSQVVANLVNNAAKYTPPGGRITLGVECGDDAHVIRVSDSGVGIPGEMLPRIFDMFTQVEGGTERAQGGLGIGLTLVKRLVELHGGSIQAESAGPGHGSSFQVRLPAAATGSRTQAPTAGRARQAAPTDAPEARQAGHSRVLVVDDNVDAATTLRLLLEMHGHEVHVAHDGQQALASTRDLRPDIVLMDIGLPGMDGFEVATRLRADTSVSQPRLIAVTGWGTEEDRRRSQEAGFDLHLVKPVDAATLQEAGLI